MKIFTNEYLLLDQSSKILVQRVGDGSIIKRFDKTPLPEKETDVVCPHFLELKWATGCPFDCSWCYLKGTLRFLPKKTKPMVKDFPRIESHVDTFLKTVNDNNEVLNTGELADSLMCENSKRSFSKFIIPFFEKQRKHKVLFLTKSCNIKNILEIEPHDQVVVSFSLNAEAVSKKWEKYAPSVKDRIEAAAKIYKAGYETRIRIDPIIPILDWELHYKELIDQIFRKFAPERITLGSLRGLQSTINGSHDKSWVRYLLESSNWGKKVEFNTRYLMYSKIIEHLKKKYSYDQIALCKESKGVWEKLGKDYTKIKCNCVW